MSKNSLYLTLAASLGSLMLSACGGSSDNNQTNQTAAHVYNVSSNSTRLTVDLSKGTDEYSFQSINFADASSISTVVQGNYSVVVSGIDSNFEQEEIFTDTVSMSKDKRQLMFLSGNYPDIALQTVTYDLLNLDDNQMRLYVGDFSTNSPGYELRYSTSSSDIADAIPLVTTSANAVSFINDFDTDTYNIYVVDPAEPTQALFTAKNVSLTGETVYFLILRDSFGPAKSGLALDKVTSSTTVTEYQDAFGDAQYRVLNVSPDVINVSLSNSDTIEARISYDHTNIAVGTATDYETVGYSDYAIEVTDAALELLISNRVISLPQNTTKGVAVYQDAESNTKIISFPESVRQLKYQSDINFVNLASDIEQVNVYFAAPGEVIDTARYSFKNVNYEDVENGVLPSNSYRISVVENNGDDTRIMLDQTDLELMDDKNYTLILYKDEAATFGYRLMVAEK